ncbi:5-formyltetrahydrofolate cyclo-ligase [Alicyclobacillus cycloheptanicus]|uniref:5-formyltetrahydrofolate cyclo-ligase n=1 Tax=Alicyclobacillus cycloheptanicus TaxID=1457 RepID=A0ABT9XJU4_9BACL|nr:5-formyltetrahydrofolate cyclo-ligase [Alicyclobacillus cycloheptanicus]MDQ0190053.1 5-formyltetrahydrofolate cyclo-ligase [Alicyclobacillus cycloheptanicus]WDM02036.1 5-formyltetrahydrofolate cyclo-ligase [Alicyclobacillus cycloheptanicus]
MAQDKRALRQHYLRLREAVTTDQRKAWNRALARHLTDFLTELAGRAAAPPTVAGYVAHRGEPDVAEALSAVAQKGWTVVYPKTNKAERTLTFFKANPSDTKAFEPGPFGILEPVAAEDAAVPGEEIDIVIVPGVAFSRDGVRLGYGGGYFDRWFADVNTHAVRVGVAWNLLLADDLPSAAHDVRVHDVVTEAGVVRCRPSR